MNFHERRAAALVRLKITPQALSTAAEITPQLRQVFRHIRNRGMNIPIDAIYYLRSSAEPEARAVLDLFYLMPKHLRRSLPLEAYCVAAMVPTLRILDIIISTYKRMGAQNSIIMAAAAQPRVMDVTIDAALQPGGDVARELLHKISGIVPLPKGNQTNISLNASASATAQSAAIAAAPPPEATIRRLADRFNENRTLPAAPPSALPEAQAENVIPMPTSIEYEEEEAEG